MVFEEITVITQKDFTQVMVSYLKSTQQVNISGVPCGTDDHTSAWLGFSFGKFSVFLTLDDLQSLIPHLSCFESLDLLTASQVATLEPQSSRVLNNSEMINKLFNCLDEGDAFQNIEEFLTHLIQNPGNLQINPMVRDIMMNRTFEIIVVHFQDFSMSEWIDWFERLLLPVLPSLTSEMLITTTSYADCAVYHVIVEGMSLVFEQMSLTRQQEIVHVLVMYLKKAEILNSLGMSCGTNDTSTWLVENFGKFSTYITLEDLQSLNYFSTKFTTKAVHATEISAVSSNQTHRTFTAVNIVSSPSVQSTTYQGTGYVAPISHSTTKEDTHAISTTASYTSSQTPTDKHSIPTVEKLTVTTSTLLPQKPDNQVSTDKPAFVGKVSTTVMSALTPTHIKASTTAATERSASSITKHADSHLSNTSPNIPTNVSRVRISNFTNQVATVQAGQGQTLGTGQPTAYKGFESSTAEAVVKTVHSTAPNITEMTSSASTTTEDVRVTRSHLPLSSTEPVKVSVTMKPPASPKTTILLASINNTTKASSAAITTLTTESTAVTTTVVPTRQISKGSVSLKPTEALTTVGPNHNFPTNFTSNVLHATEISAVSSNQTLRTASAVNIESSPSVQSTTYQGTGYVAPISHSTTKEDTHAISTTASYTSSQTPTDKHSIPTVEKLTVTTSTLLPQKPDNQVSTDKPEFVGKVSTPVMSALTPTHIKASTTAATERSASSITKHADSHLSNTSPNIPTNVSRVRISNFTNQVATVQAGQGQTLGTGQPTAYKGFESSTAEAVVKTVHSTAPNITEMTSSASTTTEDVRVTRSHLPLSSTEPVKVSVTMKPPASPKTTILLASINNTTKASSAAITTLTTESTAVTTTVVPTRQNSKGSVSLKPTEALTTVGPNHNFPTNFTSNVLHATEISAVSSNQTLRTASAVNIESSPSVQSTTYQGTGYVAPISHSTTKEDTHAISTTASYTSSQTPTDKHSIPTVEKLTVTTSTLLPQKPDNQVSTDKPAFVGKVSTTVMSALTPTHIKASTTAATERSASSITKHADSHLSNTSPNIPTNVSRVRISNFTNQVATVQAGQGQTLGTGQPTAYKGFESSTAEAVEKTVHSTAPNITEMTSSASTTTEDVRVTRSHLPLSSTESVKASVTMKPPASPKTTILLASINNTTKASSAAITTLTTESTAVTTTVVPTRQNSKGSGSLKPTEALTTAGPNHNFPTNFTSNVVHATEISAVSSNQTHRTESAVNIVSSPSVQSITYQGTGYVAPISHSTTKEDIHAISTTASYTSSQTPTDKHSIPTVEKLTVTTSTPLPQNPDKQVSTEKPAFVGKVSTTVMSALTPTHIKASTTAATERSASSITKHADSHLSNTSPNIPTNVSRVRITNFTNQVATVQAGQGQTLGTGQPTAYKGFESSTAEAVVKTVHSTAPNITEMTSSASTTTEDVRVTRSHLPLSSTEPVKVSVNMKPPASPKTTILLASINNTTKASSAAITTLTTESTAVTTTVVPTRQNSKGSVSLKPTEALTTVGPNHNFPTNFTSNVVHATEISAVSSNQTLRTASAVNIESSPSVQSTTYQGTGYVAPISHSTTKEDTHAISTTASYTSSQTPTDKHSIPTVEKLTVTTSTPLPQNPDKQVSTEKPAFVGKVSTTVMSALTPTHIKASTTAATERSASSITKHADSHLSNTSPNIPTNVSRVRISNFTNQVATIQAGQGQTLGTGQPTAYKGFESSTAEAVVKTVHSTAPNITEMTSSASTTTEDVRVTRSHLPLSSTEPVKASVNMKPPASPKTTILLASNNNTTKASSAAITTLTTESTAGTTTVVPTRQNTTTIQPIGLPAQLSTQATTTTPVPAKPQEGVLILEFRIQRVFIPAYNDPSSAQYKNLALNITTQLITFYKVKFPLTFRRCYVLRFWMGSVGVDTQLIFNNDSVVPNVTTVAESLDSAINKSEIFLNIVPNSIVVTSNIESTTTTTSSTVLYTQTQISQNNFPSKPVNSTMTSLHSTPILLSAGLIFSFLINAPL
ncbi:uncharacterized protein LOC143484441 [Brachyhypopomus gauderio]|uniref:uncharacterized protein LOC143484441 n=1 Tax=Brachyhypopomus gauderio TaxID=698409 RepID=UPI00404332CA